MGDPDYRLQTVLRGSEVIQDELFYKLSRVLIES
jgi:hypothetical protein